MRRAHNLDKNHSEIVSELKKLGYAVQDLAGMADGCPDLVVADLTEMWMVEIKDGPKAKLTEDQVRWERRWQESGGKPTVILRSREGVRKFHQAVQEGRVIGAPFPNFT